MIETDLAVDFLSGLERSLHYWLARWRQPADHAALQPLQGHALRALWWAATTGVCLPLAVDLAIALHSDMMYSGQWQEWKVCLARLAAAADRVDAARLFNLLHRLATMCFRQGDLDEALAWGERVLALAAVGQDRLGQVIAANLLAEIYLTAEHFAPAQVFAEQAVALAAAGGDTPRRADALINRARVHLDAAVAAAGGLAAVELQPLTAAQTAALEAWLHEALALVQASGDVVYETKAHLFLYHALAARGEWVQALWRAQTALALVESYGDDAGRGVVLQAVGRSLAGLSRRAEAIEALQTAIRIHERHGNRPAQQNAQRRLEKLLQVN